MVKMNKPMIVGVAAVSFILLFLSANISQARQGCCSYRGGVCGCGCCDGSPLSSTCAPYYPGCGYSSPPVHYYYGCTDSKAKNYSFLANKDDGSCIYEIRGCMDKAADNYSPNANTPANYDCVYTKEEVISEAIHNQTEYKDDPILVVWLEDVKEEGSEGKKEITYKTTRNSSGEVTNQTKLSEKVVQEPKNKVILKGTNEKPIYWVVGVGFIGLLGYFIYLGSRKK